MRRNAIHDKVCNPDKPFAFISYSHDESDTQIVRNVFENLYKKGFNLWIDTANLPYDENAWDASARKAMKNSNCKCAIYFRSESSMTKKAVLDEIETIKLLEKSGSIITVDIWKDSGMTANKFYKKLIKGSDDEAIHICKKISEYVSRDNSAIRLCDVGSDINELANRIAEQLEWNHVCASFSEERTNTSIVKETTIIQKTYISDCQPKKQSGVTKDDMFRDEIEKFAKYFSVLAKYHQTEWKKRGTRGQTPSIDMDIELIFDCKSLNYHSIKGTKWKAVFVEMMNYFYNISGKQYYDYAVKICKFQSKQPIIINTKGYGEARDKTRYSAVAQGKYYFYNSYGIDVLIKRMIEQIEMYFEFLREQHTDCDAQLSNVRIQYKIKDKSLSAKMAEIRR